MILNLINQEKSEIKSQLNNINDESICTNGYSNLNLTSHNNLVTQFKIN